MITMNFRDRFWQMLANAVGDTAYSKAPAVPQRQPVATPVRAPDSTKPILLGVHVRPWDDSATALSMLDDLKPNIERIWFPAFGIMNVAMDQAEVARLLGLITGQIESARKRGAKVLIVTSSSTSGVKQTDDDVRNDAFAIAEFYRAYAIKYPGMMWEAGNETELDNVTVETYADFFKAFVSTVRSADDSAQFITAGTSGFNAPYTRRLESLLSGTNYLALGIHPYGTAPTDYGTKIGELRVTKPIAFTEYGVQVLDPTVTPVAQSGHSWTR